MILVRRRKGTMSEQTIQSQFLSEEVVVTIYQPETFDPLYENKVCFMFDGNDYFHFGRIATVSDQLHEEEDIINTTFVGIPYRNKEDRWKKYHPDGEKFSAFQQFIEQEVVSLLDELLPLNPLGTQRALIGDSLAATVSLLTALDAPELFSYVIMQSPFVDGKVLQLVKDFKDVHKPAIYHTFGLQETEVNTTRHEAIDFVAPNRQLAQLLQEHFPSYYVAENPDGNHTWRYWQQELPDLLVKAFG